MLRLTLRRKSIQYTPFSASILFNIFSHEIKASHAKERQTWTTLEARSLSLGPLTGGDNLHFFFKPAGIILSVSEIGDD